MYVRDATNKDEAWMLEKIDQKEREEELFRTRDFVVAVDEETEQRVGFGRLLYHRNNDDLEYVEMDSLEILSRADEEQGKQLINELIQMAEDREFNRVFTFPNDNIKILEELGFENTDVEKVPSVLEDRYNKKTQMLGESNVHALAVRPEKVDYEIEDSAEDEFEKPNEKQVTDSEVNSMKEELGLDGETNTKYST